MKTASPRRRTPLSRKPVMSTSKGSVESCLKGLYVANDVRGWRPVEINGMSSDGLVPPTPTRQTQRNVSPRLVWSESSPQLKTQPRRTRRQPALSLKGRLRPTCPSWDRECPDGFYY